MSFFELLNKRIDETGACLMVGLDCHATDLTEQTGEAAFEFCKRIIDETQHAAVGYKPNAAFFERLGHAGVEALERVIEYIPDSIPVLLDAKRGDIGSTCDAYAAAAFEVDKAHGITVNAYMGLDSVEPFLKFSDRAVFVLCKTSNPSSNDFQTLRVTDEAGESRMLYEQVARIAQEKWNDHNTMGLVIGATDVEAMQKARVAAPDLWILAPGVGAQGGNLREALAAGLRTDGRGIIVPVSRGISRAESPRAAADELVAIMRSEIAAATTTAAQKQLASSADTPAAAAAAAAAAGVTLQPYQRRFIEVCLQMQVLRFGSFTLKSGRISPYFFNAGLFSTGSAMTALAQCYAQVILDAGIEFDVIFGPAYKGIPLAAAVAMALDAHPAKPAAAGPTHFAYNRKEAKDHGEGGSFVGADLRGKRVLLVDDVITAGTAIRESMAMLKPLDAVVSCVVVALDRQEVKDPAVPKSAIELLSEESGVQVVSVVELNHLVEFVRRQESMEDQLAAITDYRQKYGSASAQVP